MKKLSLLFLLIVLILGGIYFFQKERDFDPVDLKGDLSQSKEETPAVSDSEKDKKLNIRGDSSAESQKVSKGSKKPSVIDPSSGQRKRVLSEEEVEKIDQLLSEYEENWDKEMEDLFLKKLNLTKQDYEDYLLMRDGFEEDRVEAFQEFHQRMVEEHGDKYSYPPSLEMEDNDRKIKQDYLDLFRKRFGEEAYERYLNTLESYNDSIRRNADPDYGVLRIDF